MKPTAAPSDLTDKRLRPPLLEDRLRASVAAIGTITVVSGASQVAAPRLVLGMVGAERTAASAQLFATVGAFMVVVGGLLTHATVKNSELPVVLAWSTVQKVVAVTAVCSGVRSGVFKRRALAVAAFDLASAGIMATFLLRSWKRTWPGSGPRGGPAAGQP